jgi:hypothetical protein
MRSVSKEELERAVGSARSKPERIQFLGALLEKATGDPVIIVGGSAIEVYTSGRYSSADIDIVTPRTRAVKVVESWGFAPNGRVWRRKDWGIDVDLVGPDFAGSRQKIETIETPYGPVRLAGVEDLLVKRLAELKHWPTTAKWRKSLIEQIELLVAEYADEMDEDYLRFIARRDDVVDVLGDFQNNDRGL